jgi:chorismate mutase
MVTLHLGNESKRRVATFQLKVRSHAPQTLVKSKCLEQSWQLMQFLSLWLNWLYAGITTAGDDSNYGSSGVLDVLCLQALSKRVHYGKFVAEAKFRCNAGLSWVLVKETSPFDATGEKEGWSTVAELPRVWLTTLEIFEPYSRRL